MSMVRSVVGCVDTHADIHVAAAIDQNGGLLGVESFPADPTGNENLLGWLVGFCPVEHIGVEATGSWGVGLTRFLHDQGVVVVEVDRPNRQTRRKQGKSDPTDAVAAARAVLWEGVGDPEGSERPSGTAAGPDGRPAFRTSTTDPNPQPAPASGVHSPPTDPGPAQVPV